MYPGNHNENARLQALHALSVLDSPPEALFDALVRAASQVAGRPISLISLIDETRQWFKANVGLEGVSEGPREHAFCEHVVRSGDIVEVPDALLDERFSANPMVTDAPNIRAYTGIPIRMQDGTTLGALCVVSPEPGALTEQQIAVLSQLGKAASLALEQRAELLHQRETARASEQFLERTGQAAGVGGWEVDLATNTVRWAAQTCRIHDLPPGYQPTLDEAIAFFPDASRSSITAAWHDAITQHRPWDLTLSLITARGRTIWVRSVGAVELDGDGKAIRVAGALQDITDRRRAVAALEASEQRFRKLFQYSLGLICTHGMDGTILSVNPSAAASLGYAVGDMLGRNLAEFIPGEKRESLQRYLDSIRSNRVETGIMQLLAQDGSLRYWRFQNVLDTDADEPYVVGHAQDVTEQQSYERTLVEWSTMDPLTRAMNRRYLADLERSLPPGRPWACIVIDIDHFKQINDTFGHQRGDEILLEVADLLRAACGPNDVVIRMGGDEFLVFIDDRDALPAVMGRIASMQATRGVRLSTGGAASTSAESMDSVIARADLQLYATRSSARHGKRGAR